MRTLHPRSLNVPFTVHSIQLDEISEDKASFEDNTGGPRFIIEWELVKGEDDIYGSTGWKPDEQLSAEKIE